MKNKLPTLKSEGKRIARFHADLTDELGTKMNIVETAYENKCTNFQNLQD